MYQKYSNLNKNLYNNNVLIYSFNNIYYNFYYFFNNFFSIIFFIINVIYYNCNSKFSVVLLELLKYFSSNSGVIYIKLIQWILSKEYT